MADTKTKIDFGNNYGDVALNLGPDWSRNSLASGQDYMLTAVGHEQGVPDAYLKEKPKERHQFRWIDPRNQSEMSIARTKHYMPVTKTEWEKNSNLWEWNGEGFIVHNGLLLWAREEIYYIEDKEKQDAAQKQRDEKTAMSPEEERLVKKLVARGAIIEDERGRPLVPLSNKK